MPNKPVRFPNGINDFSPRSFMADFAILDPLRYHQVFDDFNFYNPDLWTETIVEGGTSSASQTITDGNGGILRIQNDDAAPDETYIQSIGEIITLDPTKRHAFRSRFRCDNADDAFHYIGLIDRDITPRTPSNCVLFKTDEDAVLEFRVAAADEFTVFGNFLEDLANSEWVTADWYWEPKEQAITYYVNGVRAGKDTSVTLPTVDMCISFGIENASAAARNMDIDYIHFIQER
jgi:hypothetical protein